MSEQNIFQTTVYAIPFADFLCSSTGGSAWADIWSVKSSTLGRVRIRSVNLGQKSTNVQGNQQLDVLMLRGSTALGGLGSVTPVNTKGWATATTANSLAYGPSSTSLGSTSSATLIYADNTDWSGNWLLPPDSQSGPFTFEAGQNFVVRVSTPPVQVSLSGTLLIEEVSLKAV